MTDGPQYASGCGYTGPDFGAPPPPAASVSPGMETLQASECTKHGEES